jgi:hypothetical protein
MPNDKRNPIIKTLVVGNTYENIWVNNKFDVDKDISNLDFEYDEKNMDLFNFNFEYDETDVIKKEGDYILLKKCKLDEIHKLN